MQGDDPPYLPVGTAVSAKYKGAFCEAKVSKVVRCVKCKITFKMGLGTATVTDEQIRGPLRVGHTVQARHSEKKEFIEATISKIQDCSQYTVVFDDGDITTLRRTALCLKSGRHFNESETLDQLPLTHPEHFGNPVVGGRRGRRSRQLKEDSSEGEAEEEAEPDLDLYSGDIGKVVCVEGNDKKKSRDNWFPGLVVVPSAQPTVRINVREEYLVRSFKDGRYYTVPKKEISEFSRDMGARVESPALTEAMEKALKYLDRDELPVHWERATLFDLHIPDSDSEENFTDSSDDEPREEKDHFVAQLYKFMDDRGTPLNKSPMIANKDVDFFKLFRVVFKLGGYNRVTNQSKWRSVTIRLGYQHNHATCNTVKQVYKKYLSSFEDFYRKLGCTMINHPRNAKKHRGRSLIRDKDRATPVNSSPRPERSEESTSEMSDKKEEPEKPKISLKTEEKLKKKEIVLDSSDSTSTSSSEGTVDVQSDSSSKPKEEVKKKIEPKVIKEKKIKGATGEKVKALVEQFEEQSKKETSKEDDKVQQTRSKSSSSSSSSSKTKEKELSSPDRKEIPGKSTKIPQKKEEDKKRGRKRKDTESDSAKAQPEPSSEPSPSTSTQPVNIGDKLKVYYGPTHESKVTYEAKVLDITRNSNGVVYRVHYTGWNTRYDEWIKPARIAENLSNTTKAKRLKQSQTPSKQTTPPKPAGKRGRGQSISSRSQDPPRSTTPSSVTSSSSRTKSPATPASKNSRVTRQAGESSTGRRTRRTSMQDLSIASDSDSEQSSQSEEELSRTRSKTDERKKATKKKDEDSEKEDEEKPKKSTKRKKSPEPKSSDEDSSSPPKGRDFDLNQIRSELKGFEKAVKITSGDSAPVTPTEEKQITLDIKSITSEKKSEEKSPKIEIKLEKSSSTEDIYEFKEPEPFEFEARASTKLNEDKTTKKRLVPRLFEDLEKSPKKKGGKSPPKDSEEKKRPFKRTPVKKEDEEETIPVKTRPLSSCEDPFDKLVESPSFNIDKKPGSSEKALNLDETLSLFRELPETVGEDRLDLSDTDDTQTEPLFSHKDQIFSEPTFSKPEVNLDPIFRGFSGVKSESESKKNKDGASDEDDSITAAIQRAISNTMTDEDSVEDDLFIYQPKDEPKSPVSIKKEPEEIKEPLSINTEKDSKIPKQISPALQETDSSLLDAISLQTEMLKKEEPPQIKTGTKIADSILQKFNMIKKNEEIKPIKSEILPVKMEEVKTEPEIAEKVPEVVEKIESLDSDIKKRNKKVISREFIEESDTDSSDSDERLIIARSDDDSQTNFKEDSNISTVQVPEVRNFPIKTEATVPDSTTEVVEAVKDEEPDISLLLCKETIPGSPAPIPEISPAPIEPRTKPKSAKSLLLEMPFASAPGSSNSKPVERENTPQKPEVKEVQPLAVPLEPAPEPEASAVIDNTPPTTPESTISNLSPRGDQDRISPNTADNESCKSTDSGQRNQSTKVTHYSEEDTILTSEPCPAPKKPPREETAAPCRKRRRSCKASDDVPAKRGRKPNVRNVRVNSDSDDTSEHSAPGSTPPTLPVPETRLSSRSPRPSKYNFIIELDPSLDSGQRISLLQQKLSELRKTYNNVKTELACIDRRRKKLRRREREALKAAKQEMACS